MTGFHPPPHHLRRIEGETKREIPGRILISRLLRYILPYKKELVFVFISIVASSVTGMLGPYILGREIVAKYILRADFEGLKTIILIFIGMMILH